MESPSEPVHCPRCGGDMESVGYNHYHCYCGCCIWEDMILTWYQPGDIKYKKEMIQ